MIRTLLAAAIFTAFVSGQVFAHGEAKHDKKAAKPISTDEKEFGREGDPKKAVRTVNVDMSDKLRFTPASLTVKRGETVKFVVKNSG